jgi:hypothetical protein
MINTTVVSLEVEEVEAVVVEDLPDPVADRRTTKLIAPTVDLSTVEEVTVCFMFITFLQITITLWGTTQPYICKPTTMDMAGTSITTWETTTPTPPTLRFQSHRSTTDKLSESASASSSSA